jgi:hypothetical protein
MRKLNRMMTIFFKEMNSRDLLCVRFLSVIDELIDEPIDWQRGKQKSSSLIGFGL